MTDVYEMKVFTDAGYFFGEIEEALVEDNRIKSWKIKAVPGSLLSSKVKDAKGVIIPQKFFKAFGDIIIVQDVDFGSGQGQEDDSDQSQQQE
jgi:sporulation protein YlmC with PRC-barrel domain